LPVLGPLNLNLLGLVVTLNQVHLNITAESQVGGASRLFWTGVDWSLAVVRTHRRITWRFPSRPLAPRVTALTIPVIVGLYPRDTGGNGPQ
jgi:hypothetical protein